MKAETGMRPLSRALIGMLLAVALIVLPALGAAVKAASSISLRSAATANNGSGSTTLVLPVPSGVQAGDVMVAQVVVNAASTVITGPAGWNLIRNTASPSVVEIASYSRVAIGSEPPSYTWAFSASEPATGGISSFVGVNNANPVDSSSGKVNATTATASFTQITITVPNDMLLAYVGVGGKTTVTPPTGFTEDYDVTDTAAGSGRTAELSQALDATTGTTGVASAMEDTLTSTNVTQLIALEPATSSPTATPTSTAPTATPTPTATKAASTSTPTRTAAPSTSTPTATSVPVNTSTPTPSQSAGGISLRTVATANNGSGSTGLVLPVPAGVQAGDVMLAQVVVNSASTVITGPSGWSLIRDTASPSVIEVATYDRIASSSEPASYSWSFNASQPATGGISSFIGVNIISPVDARSDKVNATTATASFTQIATTVPNDMLLAFVGVSGKTTVTPPTGFAEDYDLSDTAASSGKTAELSRSLDPATGTTAVGSATEDTLTSTNVTQLIALEPAASSPTATPTPGPTTTSAPSATPTSGPTATQQPSPTPASSPTPGPSPTPTSGSITIGVVGDMECTNSACQNAGTAGLISQMNPAAFFPVGDLVFDGKYTSFVNYYDPVWGPFFSLSHPALGNHDGSTAYYDYWNGVAVQTGPAGTRGQGWYSFNLGGWHFVVLNSNCVANDMQISCQPGSPEIAWLNADLSANTALCTIALTHIPYYTSGSRQFPELQTIFQTLYNYGVELYLAGHTHYYQRFYPQDANGNRNDAFGVAEIVAGTGGGSLANVGSKPTAVNEAAQIGKAFGVLQLALGPGSYSFQFLPAPGYTATDSGTGTCH